jgi:hypothetical protein
MICIYCGKSEPEVFFTSREHVIPGLMGSFDNNPTIVSHGCNICNSTTFNALENRFKEDTQEGIAIQMMNYLDSREIRVRSEKLKLGVSLGLEEEFLNEAFPFLVFKDGGWKIIFVPQIKIKSYGGHGYIILPIEKIKALSRNSTKFRKLKNSLRNVKSKDVSIFVHRENEADRKDLEEAMDLIRELGVDYKLGTERSIPFIGDGSDNVHAEITMDGSIDSSVARLMAKIAFNYFAYCAIQSKMSSILYHPNFSHLKSYVIGELDLPLKEILIEEPTFRGLVYEEGQQNMRLPGHIITFENKDGNLIAKVTFAGRFVYTILLGEIPNELVRKDFGNGHYFDPLQRQIVGLTQNPKRWNSGETLNFTLFNNG